jgi:NADPH-dependent 2,4-dienoyl-CoA reductase/sulfur reductase-like enzyme
MAKFDYVILGGGVAAGYAAQVFGEHGLPGGRLAIVSAEAFLPYDRPPLSKGFLLGDKSQAQLPINPPEFYQTHGIDVWLNTRVTGLDLDERQLILDEGEPISFDGLLIATGSSVRRLDVPGADLDRIFTLRQVGDAKAIRQAALSAERAVVIGGSFIGMEVSSALQRLGVDTTLVFPEARVWERFFTPEMSGFFQSYYRDRGVTLMPHHKAIGFEGDGAVQRVIVEGPDGRRTLPADLVVVGIGVLPNLDLFEDTDLQLDDGLVVDKYLETSVEGVYAAGDIACFPNEVIGGRDRVEHWDNAKTQGQHAARALLGEREPYVHVPYFFSDVFDLSYEFWGDAAGADEVVHRGDISSGSFSVWWLSGGKLVAAFVMDRPDEEREMAQTWIREGATVSADALGDAEQPLTAARPEQAQSR